MVSVLVVGDGLGMVDRAEAFDTRPIRDRNHTLHCTAPSGQCTLTVHWGTPSSDTEMCCVSDLSWYDNVCPFSVEAQSDLHWSNKLQSKASFAMFCPHGCSFLLIDSLVDGLEGLDIN